jgi:hypothetical protein
MIEGRVVSVETRLAGTELVGTHTAPLSTLTVADVTDLPETGTVTVGFDDLVYTATADMITLAAATTNTYADGTAVTLNPPREYKMALVQVVAGDSGDPLVLEALVRTEIQDSLVEGIRDSGEMVWLKQRDGELLWIVDEVKGQRKSVDAAYVNTGTLALSDAVNTTDATDEAVGPMLARLASWYGVGLDNPVITFEDSDGNGGRLDGPAATLSFRHGNNVVSSFSALVTRLAGLLDADQLTAAVARIFDELRIAPGGALMLESQLQPPPPPAVEVGWPFVVLDMPHFADTVTSITEKSGRLYLIGTKAGRNGAAPTIRMYSFDLDGTDRQLEWDQPIAAAGLRHGLARIGSSWFVAVAESGIGPASHVQERDLDGALVNQWALTGISGDPEVCIGRDAAGHVLVAFDDHSTAFEMQTYDTTGGAPLSTLALSPGGGSVGSIGSDPFDYGATRIVANGGAVNGGPYVYNAAGAEQVSNEWNAAPYNSGLKTSSGTCWDDTNNVWLELASDGTLYSYTTVEQLAGWDVLVPLSFLVTLRDASGHETAYDASKVTVASVRGRQGITVTAGAIPTGADRFALYASDNASPTRTQFHLVGTPAEGDRSWTLDVLTFAGAAPPSSNTMPAGVAEIQDANGVKILASDNTGSVWDAIAAGGGGIGVDDEVFLGSDYIEVTGRV